MMNPPSTSPGDDTQADQESAASNPESASAAVPASTVVPASTTVPASTAVPGTTPGSTNQIPGGIVTFLFTDVEGSTRLWAADTQATARSFVIHDKIVRDAIESAGGYVFGVAGDSFRGAFSDATSGVIAARQAQQSLRDANWDGAPPLRVRMGLHRGRSTERGGDYFGPVPNTASRIEAIAAGGQILMSDQVKTEVSVPTTWLGEHRLKDVAEPVSIHQLGHDSFRALRAVDPELSTLPNLGSQILGRGDMIVNVRGLLETSPLVTLTGTGGCGKTRLALEVAHHELPNRPDGCYFADLSAVSDGSELAAALATAIRLTLVGGDPLTQIVDHLATREALVLLDNCEHLLDACAEFCELLLHRSASTMLLATSRQRLDVAGEQVVNVASLGSQPGDDSAIELFIARATAIDPSFTVDDTTNETISEICSKLDGLPLAIELAAARSAVLSPAELLDRMGDRFKLLSGGRGRQRRRTLQATLDWSYDLLDEDEQRFFRRMGVFVGSFDLAAATKVGDTDQYETLDLLDSLVAKSLITSTPSGGFEESFGRDNADVAVSRPDTSEEGARFRLLETVRIYAGNQLARASEVGSVRDLHLDHFMELTSFSSWTEAEDLDRSVRLSIDWPNIASALEWATSTERWVEAAHLTRGSQGLWETRIPATEGRRWIELTLPHHERSTEHGSWLRRNLAILEMQLDNFERVHTLNEEVIADAVPLAATQSLGLHGFTRARQHSDESAGLLDRADELINTITLDDASRIGTSWARGTLCLYAGDVDGALTHFQTAVAFARSHPHEINYTMVAGLSLATTQIVAGRPLEALQTLDYRDWSRSVWDSSDVLRAIALLDSGRVGEAAELIVDFGHAALRGRLARQSNDALVGLAALALHRGENDHAWQLLQEAVAPRTPFTIAMAEALAARIGHGEELRERHRNRQVPLGELDATEHLATELRRLPAE